MTPYYEGVADRNIVLTDRYAAPLHHSKKFYTVNHANEGERNVIG
jgi:hypothetical protein